jgi:hypothetical protein
MSASSSLNPASTGEEYEKRGGDIMRREDENYA